MADTTHNASDRNEEGVYIPKSYQFERDMDYDENISHRKDTIQFDDDSNTHYIYHDIEELVNTEDGKKVLRQMIDNFFQSQANRIKVLESYSKGLNTNILDGRRRVEDDKADYRISHNWGGYISNFATGYVISNEVTLSYKGSDDDQGTNDLAEVKAINELNDTKTLNYELGYDTSRFGRAFEMHYRDDSGDRFTLIEAGEMFVIRSADIQKDIIGAVYLPIYNGKLHVQVMTDKEIIKYKPSKLTHPALEEMDERRENGEIVEPRKQHYYNMVPVVEWWNNRFRQGDYETSLSLFDGYDAAQSDTANYMSDLNDALLVIAGDLEAAGITKDDALEMKRANMMLLESGIGFDGKQSQLTAEYIYKQYDVNGTEAYKNRLLNDIYKLSLIPNLDDERFSNADSGVALKQKMIGLDQLRATKEAFYTKALRRRYQLIQNVHEELRLEPIDANALTFTFHPNMPEDIWSEIKSYMDSGGIISQQTLRENTKFTSHKEEEKRLVIESLGFDATDEEINYTLDSLNRMDGNG